MLSDSNGFINLLSAAIPVVVDAWQNTVTAGGVVLHGLHATVAPRRTQQTPPVLEQFSFVPYEQQTPLSAQLRQYAQDVAAYAARGLKKVVEHNKSICNLEVLSTVLKQMDEAKAASEENVAKYLSQEEQNGLIKVCGNECGEDACG